MKDYSVISKAPFLLAITLILMLSTTMSKQERKSLTSANQAEKPSLRSDAPKIAVSSNNKQKRSVSQETNLQSDSDSPHQETSLLTKNNLHTETLDKTGKNFLFDTMSQKIKNSQNTQGSTTFTRDNSLITLLHRHQGSKVSEYIKAVVENNRKFIKTHNADSKKPYKLAQNRFIIYTSDQFKQLFLNLKTPDQNYLRNQPNNIQVVPSNNSTRRNLQQVIVDWKAAKRMTSVKFQKQCGSCYAFTAISAIESAYILKGKYFNLAQQELVDCSNPYGNYGCTGGWTANAYKYIKDFGVVIQKDYPYNGTSKTCAVGGDKIKNGIKNYVELKNDCSLVIEALRNQPLSIAINADGWQYYAKGIYTDCRPGVSNHGVVLAGVDSTSWLIKNSWGYSWGEDGYIRVSRTAPNKACNVCEWASYPVV